MAGGATRGGASPGRILEETELPMTSKFVPRAVFFVGQKHVGRGRDWEPLFFFFCFLLLLLLLLFLLLCLFFLLFFVLIGGGWLEIHLFLLTFWVETSWRQDGFCSVFCQFFQVIHAAQGPMIFPKG